MKTLINLLLMLTLKVCYADSITCYFNANHNYIFSNIKIDEQRAHDTVFHFKYNNKEYTVGVNNCVLEENK